MALFSLQLYWKLCRTARMSEDMESSNSPATSANITPNASNPGTPRSDAVEMRNTPPPAPQPQSQSRQPPSTAMSQQHQQQQLLLAHQQHLQQLQSQSKYSQLLAVIEDMGRDIRPTYSGSRTSAERLKRGIVHARILVRECLMECERSARNWNRISSRKGCSEKKNCS